MTAPGRSGPHGEGSSLPAGAAAPAAGEPLTRVPQAIPTSEGPPHAKEEKISQSSNFVRISGSGSAGHQSDRGPEDHVLNSNSASFEFKVQGPSVHAGGTVGETPKAAGEGGMLQVPDQAMPSGSLGAPIGTVRDHGHMGPSLSKSLTSGEDESERRRHAEKGTVGGFSAPQDASGIMATPARRRRAGVTRYRQPCLCCGPGGPGAPGMGGEPKSSGENREDVGGNRTRVLPPGSGPDPLELLSGDGPGLLDFA